MSLATIEKTKNNNVLHAQVVAYLQTLIQFESVTPNQAGAIDWLNDHLTELGFSCEQFKVKGVTNLIAHIDYKN